MFFGVVVFVVVALRRRVFIERERGWIVETAVTKDVYIFSLLLRLCFKFLPNSVFITRPADLMSHLISS